MRSLVLLSCLLLGACSTAIDDYQHSQPRFDLKGFFTGNITGWGMVEDYANKVRRRFCVDIVGSWQGNKGQLDETFYYADGETQRRQWQLTIQPDGTVIGGAGDVVGEAKGRASGYAFNWQYVLSVPIDDTTYHFSMDDWMYLLDKEHIMNRTRMQKFGVTVSQISLLMDKSSPVKFCPQRLTSAPVSNS